MERDPNISKLIRESGVISAPVNFTAKVMEKIEVVKEKKIYKPLIGRGGMILFSLFIVGVVVLAFVYAEPGGRMVDFSGRVAELDWKLPRFNLNLDFLHQMNLSSVMVSAVVAIFILVLTDAVLNRRRFS